jgi:hypothetical protein
MKCGAFDTEDNWPIPVATCELQAEQMFN